MAHMTAPQLNQAQIREHLVGGTITHAWGNEVCVGFDVRRRDGRVVSVGVQQDPECNGPGWLELWEVKEG